MTDENQTAAPALNMEAAAAEMQNRQRRIDESIARLDKLGASVNNVDGTRDKFFIQWLFDNILTDEAKMAFTLAWLDEFQIQLTKLEGVARDAALARTKEKLGVAPPGLVVPGHLRRSGS